MPLIVTDPGILAAARSGTEVMLKFKGQTIQLVPVKDEVVAKPGGGHDFTGTGPREPQLLALSKTTGLDGIEYSANDDGMSRKRAYLLTGRYDAEIALGDTWEDEEATYVVDTVDSTNGYKTTATVTGFLKMDRP